MLKPLAYWGKKNNMKLKKKKIMFLIAYNFLNLSKSQGVKKIQGRS